MSAAATGRSSPRPLSGLHVVEHGNARGELCGRLLADLGATVVKVEPPGGAPSRTRGPVYAGTGLGFAVRNTNKQAVCADLAVAKDRSRFEALLRGADLWIDATPPGQLAVQGLDPGSAPERWPGLVVVSITDFGQTGPYRDFVATDAVMVAMGSLLFRAGIAELPPVLPPGALAGDIAGVTAAYAALTALRERRRTGRGLHVDLSVMEAVAQTSDWGLPSFSFIRQFGQYDERRVGGGKVYPIVPCKDGWVRPAIVSPPEWRKMRAWLGEPDFLQDPHWDQAPARIEIYDDILRPLYVELFADMTMIEAAEEGQARGIAVTPMLGAAGVLAAQHYAELGTFVTTDAAEGVHGPVASGFFRIDGARVGVRAPAPACPVPDDPWPDWAPRAASAAGGDIRSVTGVPWQGLRVLDFGVAGAAPEIARLLAEYGADVVRIENRRRPDVFRTMGPNEMAATFVSSSRSKRSFGVDWDAPEGLGLVERLVRGADVLVENLPPGTMARLGLGPERLRELNPRLVTVGSQSMGSGGVWSTWRGYGANTQTVSGLTALWSVPDRAEPVGTNLAMPDHVVGRLGALAVAALLHDDTPAGAHVEIAQVEVVIDLLAELFLQEGLTPGSVGPVGNHSPEGAPWGVYPCAGDDRWCVITCRGDDDWRALVAALGAPGWAQAPELATEAGRRRAAAELDEHLATWTAARTNHDVMLTLQAHGVPAGPMMYISDQPADPHLIARGYVLELDQPGMGPVLLEGAAFRSDGLTDPITRPAPLLGEHTREIAAGELGLSSEAIEELVSRGVLFDRLPGV